MTGDSRSLVVEQCFSPTRRWGRTRIAWDETGQITAVSETADPADAQTAMPGLIDSHFHGFAGVDVLEAVPSVEEWQVMDEALLHSGITSYTPAICSRRPERVAQMISRARSAAVDGLVGFYSEGPFVNPQCAGALPRDQLCRVDLGLCRELLGAGDQTIRIVMISPELPGAFQMIGFLQENRVTPALGHSCADGQVTQRAIDAGARRITHWPNAMTWGDHHLPGMAFQVLTDDRVDLEVIGDNLHVAPALIELARRCKGERLLCVSDCMFPGGMAQDAEWLARRGFEVRDQRLVRAGTQVHAGAMASLYQCFQSLIRSAQFEPPEAARVCSTTVAASLGLADRGELAVGKRADLVLLDEQGDIHSTVRKGVPHGR